MSSSRIRGIAKACAALGTLWTAAGVLKLIFGIRITLPLFPPLDLERVSILPSLTVGLFLVFAGAWLERLSARQADRGTLGLGEESVR